MRRKRLKHAADTMCHMFCGWRLANSYTNLETLGSGTLAIDALSGDATFNGDTIGPLNIAGELHAWLREDCQNNDIPLSGIHHARLTAELDFTQTEWKRAFSPGKKRTLSFGSCPIPHIAQSWTFVADKDGMRTSWRIPGTTSLALMLTVKRSLLLKAVRSHQ